VNDGECFNFIQGKLVFSPLYLANFLDSVARQVRHQSEKMRCGSTDRIPNGVQRACVFDFERQQYNMDR